MDNQKSKFDVVCAGLNVVDILFQMPDVITAGEKHPVDNMTVQGGAPAGNAACVMAALNLKTGYWGYFGENALSTLAKDELTRRGIQSDFFLKDKTASPAVAVVEICPRTGDRTVFYSMNDYRWTNEADISSNIFEQTRLILVDGYEIDGNLALLKKAQESGCPSILDLETGDPVKLREMIQLGTDTILPIEGAKTLTETEDPEAILRSFAETMDTQIVITDGKRGSWALNEEKRLIRQPIIDLPVIDTTGCGDSYHGAYAFAKLQNWPLQIRMEFASLIAGLVAGFVGGRTDLPTWEKLSTIDFSLISNELQNKMKPFLK